MAYAFKCRNCGNLEDAGNAGERKVPAACRICGAGVHFDTQTGVKQYDEDNWAVLAELDKDELAAILDFHKIKASDIEAHIPLAPAVVDREPGQIERSASETLGSEDHAG